MPIQRLVANCGIFEPEDLSFLQSIFDESCAVHEHLGEEQSTAIARKLFVLFKGGTRDRELLKIMISRRLVEPSVAPSRLARSGVQPHRQQREEPGRRLHRADQSAVATGGAELPLVTEVVRKRELRYNSHSAATCLTLG